MDARSPRAERRTGSIKAALLLAAGIAAGCAETPLVAPLRYEPLALAPSEPFRSTAPDASPVDPAVSLEWREATLKNGIRLVYLGRHALPLVTVRLVVDRGPTDIQAPPEGFALLEAMMDAGTGRRSQDELAAAYARLGASRSSTFDPDGCSFAAKVGASDMDKAIELIAETVTQPRLAAREFADERMSYLADLRGSANLSSVVLARNLRALLFPPWHPYGFIRPPEARITATRVEDMAWLHARLFHPSQMTLVVVGDATPESVYASAERWLSGYTGVPPATPRVTMPVPPEGSARVALVTQRGLEHVRAMVFARGPAAWADDVPAALVLAQALGGLTSPLQREVREETGSAYAFGAFQMRMRLASAVGVAGTLDAAKAMPALHTILAAVRQARAYGIREEDVARARTTLLAEWRKLSSSTDGLAALASSAILSGLPVNSVSAFPARVRAVTAADVMRAAQTYFGEESLRVLVVGDKELWYQLEALGLGSVAMRNGFAEPAVP